MYFWVEPNTSKQWVSVFFKVPASDDEDVANMVVAESGLECDDAIKKAFKVPLMKNIRPVEP
eukprot:9156554-Karenia_brevis.AAC.1